MKDKEMDELTALWQEAEAGSSEHAATDIASLLKAGEVRKKNSLAAHYGTAAVLSGTVTMLVFYFYYLYDFQDVLSKIGYNLMIGGLAVRIVIELFSVWRSRQIKFSDTAAGSLKNSVAFLEFRKHIHGPVTIIIFGLYFVGFYMLTPEFSKHMSMGWLILMDTSAVVVAVVLTLFIRKGIRQELRDLEKMVELLASLTKES
jgi:uncharacterized membrane protein